MKTQESSPPTQPFLRCARFALEAIAVKATIVVVQRLPRPVLGRLAWLVGTLAYFVDFRGRRTALENLRCAFPEKCKAERRAVAKQSYQHMAFTFLDLFWVENLTAENWHEYVDMVMERPEETERAERSSAIWITPHYGNFEWSALIQGLRGIRLQIIAQSFRNASLTPIFKELREVTGNRIIPQERSMLRLYKVLRRGGHTALLTDLNVDLSQSPAVIDCFGLKTCSTTLHAELGIRCGVPVVPVVVTRLKTDRYRMVVMPSVRIDADTPASQIAQECWDSFEPHIRENPGQWLWMYKHWRYLPADAEKSAYPDYANPKRKFDRIFAGQQAS